ncbi:RNA ligase family protein [uncultured Streptomyces sp.]|uniref:RNA ligase family protein n=1 Tax=uncultured Streptomyces sp. TaxID=174707 RepID=UPI00260DD03A|nr:RNA ligase family protein [uncultured Streptomyces sp.]
MRTHYPRTPHVPWSPGATSDDVRVGDLAGLSGREVVVTEKLDGENTTLYGDGLHARSLDSAHHPSRGWVKALQGRIGPRIPAGRRICGENVYARHSIPYDELEGYFYGFSVWDGDRCLPWDETVAVLRELGVPAVPVLWRGALDARGGKALRALAKGLDTGRVEGYVVRPAEGFGAAEFGRSVAKWVRAGHVTTGTHWMHERVVPNGLGPRAALWQVRSGGPVDASALAAAALPDGPAAAPDADAAVAMGDRSGPGGDARLDGVLAGLLHRERRATLMPRLARTLGLPAGRRIADLVGLHRSVLRPYPDAERRTGLIRMSYAADLSTLHALAATVAGTDEEREQAEWSALHADGLTEPAGLREAFAGLPDADARDRCLAEAREAWALGRITSAEEAVAATWRWRDGDFPRLFVMVGPSGSGKSTLARALPGVGVTVSLDDLREARGSRTDQSANEEVVREGHERLDRALAAGGTTLWDATSLTPRQRSSVHAVAARRNALVTHVVTVVEADELVRRNGRREHPVPPKVLTEQIRRYVPPCPGEAHRTWYAGPDGTVGERV